MSLNINEKKRLANSETGKQRSISSPVKFQVMYFLLFPASLIISNEWPLTLQRGRENNSLEIFSSWLAAIQEHVNRKIVSSTFMPIFLSRERIFSQKKVGTKTKKEKKKDNPSACTLLNSYYSDNKTNISESQFRFIKDLLRVQFHIFLF